MENAVRIKLNSGTSSIIKTGFVVRALVFGAIVIGTAAMGISMWQESLFLAVLCFTVSFILIIVIYRMLGTAFQTEEVLVNKEELVIIHNKVSASEETKVQLNDVRAIGFVQTHYTPNAMDSKTLDITGLGVQEREMQYVIDEGNILIETEDRTFRFGKKLPSWEVEEFIEQLERISGRKFERIQAQVENSIEELLEEEEMKDEENNKA